MDSKIVVGVDYSEEAQDALALSRRLAEVLDAQVKAVSVVEFPRTVAHALGLNTYLRDTPDELAALTREQLGEIETEFASFISDSPAGVLYAQAETDDVAVIVLGSAHRGSKGRVHPGSVANSVLHGAPCAVAVAPRHYRERASRLDTIGVAFDGSDDSRGGLATAIDLARLSGASLTVVTVVPPVPVPPAQAAWAYASQEVEEVHEKAVRKIHLDAIATIPDVIRHEGRLLDGGPGELICEVSPDFDLLVLGSRGYGPIRRAMLGSVAAKVMRSAQCPVIVLPRGARLDGLGLRDGAAGEAVGAKG